VATNGNGQGETRLDHIERLLEEQIVQNHEAHATFMQEHKLLLTAQVLMTGTMTQIETKMLEIQEKLDAMIRIVDGLIPRAQAN
jgi:hypothetical protein